MATNQTNQMMRQLRQVLLQDEAGSTDGQLLGCFLDRRDEAAFAALVKRHGPMVWNVCRRLLDPHDAEDAFQATFLVLVHKAGSIRRRERVASWLYGAAHQTALQARRSVARRRAREKQVTRLPEPAVVERDLWDDLRPLLDQELSRLPDIYRVVLILCDLEGRTREEAARQLRLPEGTVGSRLARAREKLARRLARHGLAVSGAALAAVLSQQVSAATVPMEVVAATLTAVTRVVTGQAAAGAISVEVAALTEGVLNSMLLSKLKIATVLTLLILLAGLTAAGFLHQTQAAAPPKEGDTPSAGPTVNRETQPAGPKVNQETPAPKPGEKEKTDPAISLAAGELVRVFEQNDALGDEKLVGKKVRITGTVFRVERVSPAKAVNQTGLPEKEDYYLLTLSADPKDAGPGAGYGPPHAMPLACLFPLSGRKQLAELRRGQEVTIEGLCAGRKELHQSVTTLTDCEIVKPR
jgi:RNA polymerase sigma factor (sigma-70 family)